MLLLALQTYTGAGLMSQTISRVITEPITALQNRPAEEVGMLPRAEVLINVRQTAVKTSDIKMLLHAMSGGCLMFSL